jgi:hypothetical protein
MYSNQDIQCTAVTLSLVENEALCFFKLFPLSGDVKRIESGPVGGLVRCSQVRTATLLSGSITGRVSFVRLTYEVVREILLLYLLSVVEYHYGVL